MYIYIYIRKENNENGFSFVSRKDRSELLILILKLFYPDILPFIFFPSNVGYSTFRPIRARDRSISFLSSITATPPVEINYFNNRLGHISRGYFYSYIAFTRSCA